MTELPQFQPSSAAEMTFVLPYYRSLPIHAELNNLHATKIAMLNVDVLVLMYHLARYIEGPVLELGAYVGGGSIALAWGLRDGNREANVFSVELGGTYDHPTHGSTDIVRDLRANLDKHAAADYVNVIVGDSRGAATVERVHSLIGKSNAGLLCIDSDGHVQADLDLYRDLLKPGAYLIVDDYFAPGAPHKVIPTRSCIVTLEQAGVVQPLGVYGWGTWVGRLTHRGY